ncbi:hypothetical protein GKQ77_05050 [Streptomyces sp. BG9H]|uniref:Integral membrane protein n=1 Tax=Streptomyces anatolicus TaxID=2675858 RepID=A0ABS6YIR6_9ACTN|nr:hypothetical protein [Streptomyces anatolicus]MBW5420939.1 hypothetical protein [Streptomyces anatolicus]
MTTSEQRPLTSYDRRMYRLMNRREAAPLHATAARRRAVVCAHIALTGVSVAAWLCTVVGDRRWALFAMLGLLLPWCFATGVINSSTRGLLELRVRALDERQRAEKNRVAALAHRAMLWVLLAATVGSGAAALADVEIKGLVFPVLFTVFVVHWLMPLWVAGLTARDEPDLDDDPVESAAAATGGV